MVTNPWKDLDFLLWVELGKYLEKEHMSYKASQSRTSRETGIDLGGCHHGRTRSTVLERTVSEKLSPHRSGTSLGLNL